MALIPLLRYPDPLLKQMALPVERVTDEINALIADLFETMYAAPGVGMTACHVGILKRIVVLDLPDFGGAQSFINPEILWASDETSTFTEGSVCMPGALDEITRPARVRVRYMDVEGAVQEREADGFLSTVLQHEMDQLNGIFFLDRSSRIKRERLVKKWKQS